MRRVHRPRRSRRLRLRPFLLALSLAGLGLALLPSLASAQILDMSCTPTTGPTQVEVAYSATCTASGGIAPYSWSISAGSLPNGLTLTPSGDTTTATISGTPTDTGSYSYTVQVTDSTPVIPMTATQDYSGTIAAPTITLTPTSLPSGALGVEYSEMLQGSGGMSPYTFAITSGALPDGLSLDPSSGTLSGTPTADGSFTFTVTATDNGGYTGQQQYTLVIAAPPTAAITVPAATTYAVGQAVNSAFTCTEGTGGPGITSCVDQNGHAAGAAIDTSSPGAHTYTVTATSYDGLTSTATVTYHVADAPTVSVTSPVGGSTYTVGQRVLAAYSCAEGSGGPGLMSCNGTTGEHGVVDTAKPGAHTYTVTGTSADGQVTTDTTFYVVVSNSLLAPVRYKAFANGNLLVTLKLPGRGTVDILESAWNSNLAHSTAVQQPAPGRFAFGRGHVVTRRGGTLQVLVKPNSLGRNLIAHHTYRITLRMWIEYTPTGGLQRSYHLSGIHLPS